LVLISTLFENKLFIKDWDYKVVDSAGDLIMQASKQLFNWTDTYTIDVFRPENTVLSLMIVLAIDAAKCSSND